MAKKDKDKQSSAPAGSARETGPPTVVAVPAGAAPEVAPSAAPRDEPPEPTDRGVIEQVGDGVVTSLRTVRSLLPSTRLPVYLAGTALLVAGLIDPPVALGAGLAYEALRRWDLPAHD